MEPAGSLLCSQEVSSDLYSEPDKPSPQLSILFLLDHF
jgi:hypothetical protein